MPPPYHNDYTEPGKSMYAGMGWFGLCSYLPNVC